MAIVESREDAVKALHRMIVYVRNEAARLRIDDAAILLGYAEDAILTRQIGRGDDVLRESPVVSLVQH